LGRGRIILCAFFFFPSESDDPIELKEWDVDGGDRESRLDGMEDERISSESKSESESESEESEDAEPDSEDEEEDAEEEESVISVSWSPDCPFGFISNTPRPRFISMYCCASSPTCSMSTLSGSVSAR
jgi:hypothetical protein